MHRADVSEVVSVQMTDRAQHEVVPFAESIKRIVIVGVSLVVFVVDSIRDAIRWILGGKTPTRVVVLAYHSIPKQQRAAFARQMDKVLSCSEPRRADAPISCSSTARYVSVTFDDGYQNIVDNALPALAQRGIPATLFIAAGALGKTPSWEDYSGFSDPDMDEPLVTAEQLRKLSSDLVQIGSHTLTHPKLTQLSEEQSREELAGSREMLEQITGSKVKLFSFPYGSVNVDSIAWCRDVGYEHVFITHPRPEFSRSSGFIVGRIKADPHDWPLEFHLKLHGAYRWRNNWRCLLK
jgi:peptidoglycan/xylan/chitin deacetylase (PgdA/CDA1 family)